jgi:UDP-N-acetyl-D-glucosamine dehydrogenase
MRESPALDVLELLHRRGAILSYTDPHVPTLDHGDLSLKTVPEAEADKGIDCAVVCTNHTVFNYAVMPKNFPLVVDTRNALKNADADNVFRL